MLEHRAVYHVETDDLYELDEASFAFLRNCGSEEGCEDGEERFVEYCLREGILSRTRVPAKRPPIVQAPIPSLRYLELQITNSCNLRCKHCYLDDHAYRIETKSARNELSVDTVERVLQEFEEMQGLRVLISGGEPLLHSRFEDINTLLPNFAIRTVLMTNGLLLTERLLSSLRVNEIQISIDGLEASHDALRGLGSFRVAMDAVKRSIAAGFHVSIATMVHRKNLQDFPEMEKLFSDLGVREWLVDVPCVTGRLRDNPDFQLSPEEAGAYLRYGYGEGFHGSTHGYACGTHLMAITADGKAAKCSFYADRPVGSVTEGIGENWRRVERLELSELRCDCAHINECRGGCRYRAFLLGDERGKDSYRCNFYGLSEPVNGETVR